MKQRLVFMHPSMNEARMCAEHVAADAGDRDEQGAETRKGRGRTSDGYTTRYNNLNHNFTLVCQ